MEENNNNPNGDKMNTTLNNAAIALNLCTADEAVTVDEVMDRAEALRHSDMETRSAWCRVWNAVNWLAQDDGPEGDDKFGFAAGSRATHTAVVALYA